MLSPEMRTLLNRNTDDWRVTVDGDYDTDHKSGRTAHLLDESSGQLENIEAVREEQNVTTTDTTFSHLEKGRAEEKRTEKKWAGGQEIKKSVETQEPESAHFPEKGSGQGGQEGDKKTKQSLERQRKEEVSAFPEETDTSQERGGQSGHQ